MLEFFEHGKNGSIYQGYSHKLLVSKEKMPPNEWENLWQEYVKVFEKWREIFDAFQEATMNMQKKYNEVMEKAANNSSKDTMKLFGENWQKSLNESGANAFKQFSDNWEKAMNEYTSSAFKQFGENWQKSMSQSGMESFKSYEEMMNKFAETWKSMWPKK
jgi:hypothetical protein